MTEPTRRRLDLRADPDADLTEVAGHLSTGGVIAYPTETVYGLGSVCTARGVASVRALKNRTEDKPLIALVASAADVAELGWSDEARELASIFWPGPLTLVLADPRHRFPPGVRDPVRNTVAVRVSPHPVVARLLDAVGAPLTSTSLNVPGGEPARSGGEAVRVVRALHGDDVWVLDAGTLPVSSPSTVIDCSGPLPAVLRHGTVPIGRLRCAIPEIHDRSS